MDDRKDKGREGKVGRHGEDLVCRYMMDAGHTILERNWRYGHLEVDIISMDGNGIHFVEVKSRRTPVQADPAESVNAAKQKRIAAAASGYLRQKGFGEIECFFDVAAVVFDGKRTEIRYCPQAYIPMFV